MVGIQIKTIFCIIEHDILQSKMAYEMYFLEYITSKKPYVVISTYAADSWMSLSLFCDCEIQQI